MLNQKKIWSQALLGFGLLATPILVQAHNLLEVYNIAVENDANLRAAESVRNTGLESSPKALASLFPTITGNYSISRTESGITGLRDRNVDQMGLTLSQPIYQHDLWAGLKLANQQVKQAQATYAAAQQNLIIRVATQYFAVLNAQDTLKFATQQRIAFQRQLDQTKQRFDVGLIAITDVHEATARRDGAVADELGATNDLADEFEKLQEITKVRIDKISSVTDKLPLAAPSPNKIEDWVAVAGKQNYALKAAYYAKQVARSEILRQNTGHMPQIQFQASLKRGGSTLSDGDFVNKQAILQANMPIFAGGGTQAKVREATASYHRFQHLHDAQLRLTLSNTKQAFRGVLTQISQVDALKQAVRSNQSALNATEAAYEVGTRTIVDVLNSQTNLLNAERQHSQAKNKYIVEILRLKEAAGTLAPEDVKIVNQWLQDK